MNDKIKKRLDGSAQSICEVNLILYGCGDPDLDFFKGISSEGRREIWDLCRPKLKPEIGIVMITGTTSKI
ncbi:MAG: hypothetical protein H8E51_06965 [Bacteroidetes bacterium]|nr:hypothetical protein [Bacteroidota bacterium]